jgi:site-specific DNA-methyltransferase (adenine-specific)
MSKIELQGKHVRLASKANKTLDLYNMDCLEGLDLFSKDRFDVVVTSPPYNLGISYGQYDDNISRSKYLNWIETIAIKIKEKMKDEGSFFLNMGASPTNPWGPFEVAMKLRSHFQLQNIIHWIKSIYIENESYGNKLEVNVGHYKPINGRRFLNDSHEYIFHFTKSGSVPLDRLSIGVPYKDSGNVSRWKAGGAGKRCRGNTWYVPYKTIRFRSKERPHPATFPIELAEKCILLHGINDGLVVLDPFMGIGHTSMACAKLKVNCVGFEIDTGYFESNLQILQSEFDQQMPNEMKRRPV